MMMIEDPQIGDVECEAIPKPLIPICVQLSRMDLFCHGFGVIISFAWESTIVTLIVDWMMPEDGAR